MSFVFLRSRLGGGVIKTLVKQCFPVSRVVCNPVATQKRSYVYIQSPPGGWANLKDSHSEDDEEDDDSNDIRPRMAMGDFRENTSTGDYDEYADDHSDFEDFYEISMPGGREIMDIIAEEKDDSMGYYTAMEVSQAVDQVCDMHAGLDMYGHRMVRRQLIFFILLFNYHHPNS